MGRKQKPPWGDILGKPIAYHFKDIAKVEQTEKMLQLKKLYGAADWYELALKIASELDDALTIVDPPPKGKKAPRWAGAEGMQIINEVRIVRETLEAETGHQVSDEAVLADLQEFSTRYRKMKPATLKAGYLAAKRYHQKKS